MCMPYTPTLQTSVGFVSFVFFCCEFCESSLRGPQMIQDYEQHNRQKSNDSRQNLNRTAVSGEFTSSWSGKLMYTFVLVPLLIQRDRMLLVVLSN